MKSLTQVINSAIISLPSLPSLFIIEINTNIKFLHVSDNVIRSSEEPVVARVKRSRQRSSSRSRTEAPVKRLKLTFRHERGWGQLLTVGQGDTGQLGLGEDVMEKMRPAPVPDITEAVDAVAGGMHTVVLDRFFLGHF